MADGILVGIIPTVDHSVGLVHHRIQGGQVDVLSVVCIVIEGDREGQRTGGISLDGSLSKNRIYDGFIEGFVLHQELSHLAVCLGDIVSFC